MFPQSAIQERAKYFEVIALLGKLATSRRKTKQRDLEISSFIIASVGEISSIFRILWDGIVRNDNVTFNFITPNTPVFI